MILKTKPIPEYVYKEIEKIPLEDSVRRCVVSILEEDAIAYINPESFDFSDVYGNCEFSQFNAQDVVVSSFQFEKNVRSFEQEAISQRNF